MVWTFNANISTEHGHKINAQLVSDHVFKYVFFLSKLQKQQT